MTKVKIIDSRKKQDFESKVNDYLKELQDYEIIDIKYSASVLNSLGLPLVYSAMIIYKWCVPIQLIEYQGEHF